jgi:hypothetical protein
MSFLMAGGLRRALLCLVLVILMLSFRLFPPIDQPAITLPLPDLSQEQKTGTGADKVAPSKDTEFEEIELALGHEKAAGGRVITTPSVGVKFTPETSSSSTSKSIIQVLSITSATSSTSSTPEPTHTPPQLTLQPDIDYRDPFNVTRNLTYGPWRSTLPRSVLAGEPFQLVFHCTLPDSSLCPPYFLVFFHGPTRQTIPPENFRQSNSSAVEFTHGTVEAEWTIRDPGEYLVYAFPDFVYSWEEKKLFCKTWKEDMEVPFHETAVEGTPFRLTVKPNPLKLVEEKWEGCSAQDHVLPSEGRYVSTNTSLSSPGFSSYYNNTSQKFVWSPYNCKIPHRRVEDAVSETPNLKHVLVVGDSTSRAFFCTRIWEDVHGFTKGTLCDYIKHDPTYWDQNVGHKFTWKVFNDGTSEERNVSFTSIWAPFWGHNSKKANPVILGLDPPPTHVVFTIGRYSIPWTII